MLDGKATNNYVGLLAESFDLKKLQATGRPQE
jgi:hypothetical protein